MSTGRRTQGCACASLLAVGCGLVFSIKGALGEWYSQDVPKHARTLSCCRIQPVFGLFDHGHVVGHVFTQHLDCAGTHTTMYRSPDNAYRIFKNIW